MDETALEEIKQVLVQAGAMSQEDTEYRVQVYPLPNPIVLRPFTDLTGGAL